MQQRSALFSSTGQRRWLWQLLCLLLGVALLGGSVWLYYDYQVRQLEQQQQKLMRK
jgi:hypothetical protein